MHRKFYRPLVYALILFIGISIGVFLEHYQKIWSVIKRPITKSLITSENLKDKEWGQGFESVEIKSNLDGNIQKAYFYKSKSGKPRPLVVSLHQWTANYSRNDSLADLCKLKDVNYIHPDFRGSNNTKEACCSDLALNDIDEAILFAIRNSNVDTSSVFIIGASGGGYATLCSFMKSKVHVKKFSAWASICDLTTWYDECLVMQKPYTHDILKCTDSKNGILNLTIAKQRSPVYWDTPSYKFDESELSIYAGIYDGIRGAAPFTHSINFYNKILTDLSVRDSSLFVTDNEKLYLLEFRKPIGDFGKISGRKICLMKKYKNVKLIIFEGGHEMLTEFALNELLESK